MPQWNCSFSKTCKTTFQCLVCTSDNRDWWYRWKTSKNRIISVRKTKTIFTWLNDFFNGLLAPYLCGASERSGIKNLIYIENLDHCVEYASYFMLVLVPKFKYVAWLRGCFSPKMFRVSSFFFYLKQTIFTMIILDDPTKWDSNWICLSKTFLRR